MLYRGLVGLAGSLNRTSPNGVTRLEGRWLRRNVRGAKSRRSIRRIWKAIIRKILVTPADMLGSARLERLAQRLRALQTASGMTNPEYAEFLGMSGSQFRYVRRRLANPSVHMLAHVAKQTKIPLYELLERRRLGDRKRLSGPQMSKHFGKVVSRFYEASGLSKQAFADSIDVGFSQLYVIMKGDSNPALLVAEELAQRLGITLWQLLGVEPFDGPG